jgi:hypothetical protein
MNQRTKGERNETEYEGFALAFALVWGFGLLCLTWWIIAFDGATGETTLIGRLYRGYNMSSSGSVIGLKTFSGCADILAPIDEPGFLSNFSLHGIEQK